MNEDNTPEETLPWERQKNETNKAYNTFCIYRDAGMRRSLRNTITAIFPKLPAEKYTTKIRGIAVWSSKYTWVKRVEAWDAFQEQEFRKELEIARKKMAERQAAYGIAMQAKGITRIRDLETDDLNPDQANRLVVEGAKLERVAMGEPDKVEVHHGGAVAHDVQLSGILADYADVITKITPQDQDTDDRADDPE